jgi:hypothetical protein
MSQIYMTAHDLTERNRYDTGETKTYLEGIVLTEGVHFFRSVTGRKTLYIWEAIDKDIQKAQEDTARSLMNIVGIPDRLPLPLFIGDINAKSNEEAIITWMHRKPPMTQDFCWSIRDWSVLLYDELSHVLDKFD